MAATLPFFSMCSGAITTQGQTSFLITNFDADDGIGGGTILAAMPPSMSPLAL